MNKRFLPFFALLGIFGLCAVLPADAFAQAAVLAKQAGNVFKNIRTLVYIAAAIAIIWQGADMIMNGGTAINWAPIRGIAYGLILVYAASWIVQGLVALTGGGNEGGIIGANF